MAEKLCQLKKKGGGSGEPKCFYSVQGSSVVVEASISNNQITIASGTSVVALRIENISSISGQLKQNGTLAKIMHFWNYDSSTVDSVIWTTGNYTISQRQCNSFEFSSNGGAINQGLTITINS